MDPSMSAGVPGSKPSRQTALRHVAHANLRLLSHDDASLTDAADYLCRALAAVEALRFPAHDPIHVSLSALLKEPTK